MTKKAIIIGAGITGLSAGWKLSEVGYKVKVIEKENHTGGMASTFIYKDCYLDLGPHKIFTVLDDIMKEIEKLYKEEGLLLVKKTSRVRLLGKYLRFPMGFKDIFLGLNFFLGLKCGFGYFISIIRNIFIRSSIISYEDWVIKHFGKTIYNLILGPYANKIWGDPLTLSKELAETRIAAPSLMEMIKQILFSKKEKSPVINAEYFFYPHKGGSGSLIEKMVEKIKSHGGEIILSRSIKSFDFLNWKIKKILYDNGENEIIDDDDIIIGTIPIPQLVTILNSIISNEAKYAAGKLKFRKLLLLYLIINEDRIIPENWLFFPESKYRFNRVFEQKSFNMAMVPAGKTVVCFEITCGEDDILLSKTDQEIYQEILPQINEAEIIKGKIIEYFIKKLEYAYPVYDISYNEHLTKFMREIDKVTNFYSVGRQGGYSYTGMADSMHIGISTAQFILDKKNRMSEWPDYSQQFYKYKVVD
jgi:protoporphyrinogen oxidase